MSPKKFLCELLMLGVGILSTATAQAQSSFPPLHKTPVEIIRDNEAAVALILSADEKEVGLGTGFFILDGTALVTNFHVVEGATAVVVKTASGEVSSVDSVWVYDEQLDIAILKIEPAHQPTVTLGDSESARPGEPVTVISNPEGLERSVTSGLISGVRSYEAGKQFQISAAISSGSSGGPVFDDAGRVIGVVRAYLVEGQNLNFAIPINAVLRLWADRKLVPLSALPATSEAAAEREHSVLDGGWSATFADSITSGQVTFTLVDDAGHIQGTYATSHGLGGIVRGTVSGDSFSFELTQATKDCPGDFKGSATIGDKTMFGTYSGHDCQGEHLKGSLTMSRSAPSPNALPQSQPTPGNASPSKDKAH